MAGLDVNYLDAVRDLLYNKKPKPQEAVKKRKKSDLEPSGSGGPSGAPTSKLSLQASPLNTQDSAELETKPKKHKELQKHDESMFQERERVKFKIKKKEKVSAAQVHQRNLKKSPDKQQNGGSTSWATETLQNPVKPQKKSPEHDFYDDHSVTVKGLSFTKLCSPFRSPKLLNTNFVIPKKHLIRSPEATKELTPVTPVNDSARKENGVKKVILPDNTIITIIDFNETVYFNGASVVRVLWGEIEVLGAVINANQGEKAVYSPRGSSLLYLKNTRKLPGETTRKLQQLLPLLKEDITFQECCAVVQLKQLINNHSVDFLQRHISQKIFPDKMCDFELSGAFSLIKDTSEWRGVVKTMGGDSRVAICGGKGVGKSTLLRYCINSLLGRFEKVVVVDLDPGQSEFFPPGCLSITTVTEMVLGPNYTHLQTPDCAVLSHINMAHDVRKYLNAVKYLLNRLTATALPVLINFPGFTQGLGLDMSVKALKWCQPNRVIEIKSKNPQKNYVIDLKSKNVNPIGMFGENEEIAVSYAYTKLDSLAEKGGAWSLEARQAREFSVLSYFGRMTSQTVRHLTSCQIAMININISALNFVNHDGNTISPLVVNANVVALCQPEPTGLYICHGFGFVRGLDLDNNTLVLLTPEPFERLNSVTHLVLSSVTAPPSLLMHADGVKGCVPYVSFGTLVDLGQLTKRPYLPPRK